MPYDFLRRVVGYNWPFIYRVDCWLDPTQAITLDLPAGPGEIFGWVLWKYGGSVTDLNGSTLDLVVDGELISGEIMQNWMGMYSNQTFHNLFATNNYLSANETSACWKHIIPYEETASWTYTNTGAGMSAHTFYFYFTVYK